MIRRMANPEGSLQMAARDFGRALNSSPVRAIGGGFGAYQFIEHDDPTYLGLAVVGWMLGSAARGISSARAQSSLDKFVSSASGAKRPYSAWKMAQPGLRSRAVTQGEGY